MPQEFWILITAVASSLVTALVSVIARVPIEPWILKVQHRSRYEWAAYRRLAETLAGPKGQALDAAFELHRRIRNLEEQIKRRQKGDDDKSWLVRPTGYYFSSFVYRVARLAAWVEVVRRLLPQVDISIPQARWQWEFVRHLLLVRESFTSPLLFYGLDYDQSEEHAHLFAGTWVVMASKMMERRPNGACEVVIWEDEFERRFVETDTIDKEFRSLVDLLRELDVPQPNDRLWCFRWARIKAVHYACALLLAKFGSHLQSDFRSLDDAKLVWEGLRLIQRKDLEQRVVENFGNHLAPVFLWPASSLLARLLKIGQGKKVSSVVE